MLLLQSQWILNGSGVLFSQPFVSRVLLYRLYDSHSSLLLYHAPDATSSSNISVETGMMAFDCAITEPEAIHVHAGISADEDFATLIKRPSTLVKLSKDSIVRKAIGEITLDIELVRLPLNQMVIAYCEGRNGIDCEIAGSPFRIKTAAPVAKVEHSGTASGAYRCWKTSVTHCRQKQRYGINSANEWSLTALLVEGNSRIIGEMSLQRKI